MEIVAYTDGSYQEIDGVGPVYSGATVIYRDGADPVVLTTAGSEAAYLSMRNVAGEILAAMLAAEYCMNTLKVTQDDLLIIAHDYTGIHNWLRRPGEKDFWKATKPLSMYYRDFMNSKFKPRCKLAFKKIKAHTGDQGNTLADYYANEAIKSYVKGCKGTE